MRKWCLMSLLLLSGCSMLKVSTTTINTEYASGETGDAFVKINTATTLKGTPREIGKWLVSLTEFLNKEYIHKVKSETKR